MQYANETELTASRLLVDGTAQPDAKLAAFEIIKRARNHVSIFKAVKPQTEDNYQRKSALLDLAVDEAKGYLSERWETALAPYAPVSNSFFAMRAAAVWSAKTKLRTLLSEQDQLQRTHGWTADWLGIVDAIQIHVDRLEVLDGIDRQGLLEQFGLESKRKTSKRHDLLRFPDDWRALIVQCAQRSPTYADAICVLAATGCRSVELMWGVRLRLEYDCAVASIRGAKTTAMSGQAWREVYISLAALTPNLLERLQEHNEVGVGIWSTGGLRSYLRSASGSLWPSTHQICPYHFRHAQATDLRETGWEAHEIGAVLGHLVSETSSGYGLRRRPGQRSNGAVTPPAILRGRTETARVVRPLKQTWSPPSTTTRPARPSRRPGI